MSKIDELLDLNGNPLPMPILVLRTIAFGVLGVFILLAFLLGADTTLQEMQTIFGMCGAVAALVISHVTHWRRHTSPAGRFAFAVFLGTLIGTVIATVLFGHWTVGDSIAVGLGAGMSQGVMLSLGAISLRAAVLPFVKKMR